MRIVSLILVISAVSLDKKDATAFHSFQCWLPRRRSNGSISTQLAVASKPPRGNNKEEKKRQSGWENFKRAVYNGVDSVGDLTSKVSADNANNEQGISDGYSSFEQSIKKGAAPGSKLMAEYEARASALGLDKAMSSNTAPKQSQSRTSFDEFKENLYSASDAFGALAAESSKQTPLARLERSIPYKESLAQELGVASEKVEDLLSDNPVKRFQAQQDIREREARQRAEARNERIRAKKEDLYKIVDSMAAAVDAFPDAIDNTIEIVKDVPTKVGKVVDDVKSIPSSLKVKAGQTKQSVEGTIEKTKKVVEDVVDIPNKVTKKVKDTTQSVLDTKETIDDGLTNLKVLLRLEQPKPKPPKMPPPTPTTAKDIALTVAGSAARGAGKVTWWATKNVATAAWNGAQSAIKKRQKLPSTSTDRPPKPPSTPPQSKTEKQMSELQREIDEALLLAEETLQNADE